MAEPGLAIEVAYALPDRQWLVALDVPPGTTARQAAVLAGLIMQAPDLDPSACPLGIHGKRVAKPEERVLQAGDRVELYRPLLADPKDVRKQRAARAAEARR